MLALIISINVSSKVIAILFILMLKITRLLKKLTQKVFKFNNNEAIEDNDSRTYKTVVNLFNKLKKNKFKNLLHIPNIRIIGKFTFLNFNAEKTLNYLR